MRTEVRRLLGACAAAAGLAACAGAAQHAGHGTPPAQRVGPSSLGVDARDRVWVVYQEGAHVKVRSSGDGGETWGDSRVVNAESEVFDTSRDARPKIAFGPGGEVYVTWTRGRGRGHVGDVRFARSLDGAATFEAPVTVHVDRQEIQHSFEAIAVTPQGRIFVAWIDKRDGRTGLYFTASDDRGATFRPERPAGPGSCECCRVALVPQRDDTALAFWRHVFDPDLRDHALARLDMDKGAGGLRRATFDGWRTTACPHQGPSMAQDAAGRLHAVWFSGTPGKEGVYYGRLRADGVDGQRRVGSESAANADVAASGERVAVAWREFDGRAARLKALRSDDAGATWREVELATDEGATDQPKVVARDGAFLVLWGSRAQPLRTVKLP
jgi:hypothetical protein